MTTIYSQFTPNIFGKYKQKLETTKLFKNYNYLNMNEILLVIEDIWTVG